MFRPLIVPLALAATLLALGPPALDRPARADPTPVVPKLGAEQDQAVAVLSRYLAGDGWVLDDALSRVGFDPPPALKQEWPGLSPREKVETAVLMAENGEKGQGGRVLALLSAYLSRLSDPVRAGEQRELNPFLRRFEQDAALQAVLNPDTFPRYFRDPPSAGATPVPRRPIPFKPFDEADRAKLRESLTPEMNEAITTLGRILEHGPLGDVATVLNRYCGKTREAARDIHLRVPGFGNALRFVLADLDVPKQGEVIRKMYKDLIDGKHVDYYVLAADDNLKKRYLPEPPPPSGPTLLASSKPPDRPRGPATTGTRAADRYVTDLTEKLRPPKDKPKDPEPYKFDKLRHRTDISGGGLFGSPVNGDDLPKGLKRVTFAPAAADPARGEVWLEFAGGQKLAYPAAAEDVYAAHAMVTARHPNGDEWKPGDGVVLVGMTGVGQYLEFGPTAVRRLTRWVVRIHPALQDTDLGHAVVMVDVLPSSGWWALLQGLAPPGVLPNSDGGSPERWTTGADGWPRPTPNSGTLSPTSPSTSPPGTGRSG